ncbi:MAG: hypothetical protein AAF840_00420 [Bacteroidota bacterium]
MKTLLKTLAIIMALLFLPTTIVLAQSPEAFKYQAVVRNPDNTPIISQAVSIRISILQGSATGPVAYQESHTPTTSGIGLIALNIGEGTPLVNLFADIAWATGDHFLQVEVDLNGGTSYQLLGTSQLLSVPYALYAKRAGGFDLEAGNGIEIDGNVISNVKPSLWQQDDDVVFVENESVGIGNTGTADFPAETKLFVNGNVRVADDAAISGAGQIVGAQGISFAASPDRSDDMVISNRGRVTFEEEVGINQTFSFIDLNVRNQAGNSTIFQVEDTTGFDIFEIGRGGNVGINRITNNVTLQVRNKENGDNNIIANFEKVNGDNVFQIQADNDVVVTGDFSVNNGNKNFILDHPLDPANKILAHNAVESPDHVTYYDGTVRLDENGEAVVKLPDYFEALNTDYNYQLTCVGAFAQVYIASEIRKNQFTIAGGQAGMKVSWQVSARRDDPWAHDHPYQAEEDKEPGDKGKYYYPEGYGKDRSFKIGSDAPSASEDQ